MMQVEDALDDVSVDALLEDLITATPTSTGPDDGPTMAELLRGADPGDGDIPPPWSSSNSSEGEEPRPLWNPLIARRSQG